MKFLVTFCLVLSIFTTQCMAQSNNALKVAYDELSYALQAGDSNDLNYRNQQLEKFKEVLVQQAIPQNEVVDFAINQIKDQAQQSSIREALALIDLSKATSDQVEEVVVAALEGGNIKGASWDGDMTIKAVSGAALAALVIVMIVGISNDVAKEKREGK